MAPRPTLGPFTLRRGVRHGRRSPRFVVRVLAASFVSVLAVLAAMSAALLLQARALAERDTVDDLAAAHRQLAATDQARHRDSVLRAELIGLDAMMHQALLTFQNGRAFGADPAVSRAQQRVLQWHIEPAARHLAADVIAIAGWDGRVIASAGVRADEWPEGAAILAPAAMAPAASDALAVSARGAFWATVAPIVLDDMKVGYLVDARAVDQAYVDALAQDTRSDIVVLVDGRPLAASGAAGRQPAVADALRHVTAVTGTLEASGERYAYLRLRAAGPAAVFAVASITAGRDRATAMALPTLATIAAGGIFLCTLASVWLAERVAAPIDRVARDVRAMAQQPGAGPLRVPSPSIHELDTLTEAFNGLFESLVEARGEAEDAYMGAIGALVAGLDARDPYTAGHSQRVSDLSVAMGQVMDLPASDLAVLRLGALLHDIGKLGISDAVLGKPDALTDEEFEAIKRHPLVGANILSAVRFLWPHIPIVELHHERPDGLGYPHGLHGDAIPLLARIVHVADAYDAMVTARAYRRPRPRLEALEEVRRHAGTAFDAQSVTALGEVLVSWPAEAEDASPADAGDAARRAS
jgi:putative nucleotidyltransferase with HDIG domain